MATIEWTGEGAPEDYTARRNLTDLVRRVRARQNGDPLDGPLMPEWMTRMILSEIYGCPERIVDDVVAYRLANL
jgi:hypothetical protein